MKTGVFQGPDLNAIVFIIYIILLLFHRAIHIYFIWFEKSKKLTNLNPDDDSFLNLTNICWYLNLTELGLFLRRPWGLVACRWRTLRYLHSLFLESSAKLFNLSCMRMCWYKHDPWPEDQKPHKWSRGGADRKEAESRIFPYIVKCKSKIETNDSEMLTRLDPWRTVLRDVASWKTCHE